MSIELNKFQTANINAIYNNPQKISFRKTTSPIPNDTVELSSKKNGMSNGVKIAIGLGSIGTIVCGILLHKHFSKNKVKEVFNSIEQIDKKFAELENNLPNVQKKFKEAFLRNDLTEKQTKEILNGYKEVEKLGLKSSKEEYVKAVFEQAKKNYQIYNPTMKIEIKNLTKRESAFAGCPMNNEAVYITNNGIKMSRSELFEFVHHELRHAKQNEHLYNTKPDEFKTAIYEGIVGEYISKDGDKFKNFYEELRKSVGSRDFSKKEVQEYIDKKIVNVSKMIEENFNKPDINNVPENYRETVNRIWSHHYTTIHYPQRMEEIDAFKIGNMMRKLIFE